MPSSSPERDNIAEKLLQIQQNIHQYCQQYQRDPASVRLLAVSKTRPADDIRAAFNAGQRLFGENYLQEALKKMQQLHDLAIEWHFIGAIQSNKTRDLAKYFSWVHSVDRYRIAQRLNQQRPDTLPPLNICLQLNISHEASKAGIDSEELDERVAAIMPLENLCLRGLMAIPAKADSLAEQREVFSRVRRALQQLQQKYPQLDTLSMGMTNDMQAAIAEGSTLLRIGTAIFGART